MYIYIYVCISNEGINLQNTSFDPKEVKPPSQVATLGSVATVPQFCAERLGVGINVGKTMGKP